jgi:3-hydroxyisobutyrate dehydrogenase-like beta-hydroxyacid dehydrogenase
MKMSIIGLGIIGSIWARHAREDGHEVTTWNRTPKPAEPGFTPELEKAAADADIIHICIAGPPEVQQILDVLRPGLRKGQLIIQSSTISPDPACHFQEQVEGKGADYIEAPFTGSKPAAEDRQLVFFLGGKAEVIDRGLPYLEALSRKQFRFPTPAQAAAIKLSMNLQIAAVSQALTEGHALALSRGISHHDFYEVLRENVAHSGLSELKEPKLKSGNTDPQFSVKHMRKDLDLALQSAGDLHLSLTGKCRDIYDDGIAAGLGDADFIALKQLIHE